MTQRWYSSRFEWISRLLIIQHVIKDGLNTHFWKDFNSGLKHVCKHCNNIVLRLWSDHSGRARTAQGKCISMTKPNGCTVQDLKVTDKQQQKHNCVILTDHNLECCHIAEYFAIESTCKLHSCSGHSQLTTSLVFRSTRLILSTATFLTLSCWQISRRYLAERKTNSMVILMVHTTRTRPS